MKITAALFLLVLALGLTGLALTDHGHITGAAVVMMLTAMTGILFAASLASDIDAGKVKFLNY